VLSGAPAIVSAVSRYVVADTARPATLVTDEVRAALRGDESAPWFDAAELREDERKLGLGSSAAILAASLCALEAASAAGMDETELRRRVFERSLAAHRAAQGGGSGVDVAASTFGGTLIYQLLPEGPRLAPVELPPGICIEVWICPSSASTRDLLSAVARLAQRAPGEHAQWLGAQASAAVAAAAACEQGDVTALLAALSAQQRALGGLGAAAGVPIVTPELLELEPRAEGEGGALLPAGAGGGDIALFVGRAPSTEVLRRALENHAHRLLRTELSAPGVSLVPPM
jgi:phosphomevalonate kinase